MKNRLMVRLLDSDGASRMTAFVDAARSRWKASVDSKGKQVFGYLDGLEFPETEVAFTAVGNRISGVFCGVEIDEVHSFVNDAKLKAKDNVVFPGIALVIFAEGLG